MDAHKRVAGAYMARQGVARHIALHGAAQVGDLLAVDVLHLRQRGGCIGVPSGGDEGGQVGHVSGSCRCG